MLKKRVQAPYKWYTMFLDGRALRPQKGLSAMRGRIQSVLAIAFAVLMTILYFAAPDLAETLTVEDGAFENVTALLYLFAAIAFVVGARRGTSGRGWLLLLAAASFFVAGEEISWGQRIIGFATPDAIADVNVQDEVNLHNIEGIHGNIRALAVLFVAAFCVLLPITERFVPEMSRLYSRWRIPVFPMSALGWVVVAIGFMVIPRIIAEHVGTLDEVGETALGMAFALYGWAFWRPARHLAQPAPVAERALKQAS